MNRSLPFIVPTIAPKLEETLIILLNTCDGHDAAYVMQPQSNNGKNYKTVDSQTVHKDQDAKSRLDLIDQKRLTARTLQDEQKLLAQAQAEARAQAESQAQADTQARTRARARAQAKAQAKVQAQAAAQAQAQAQAKAKAKVQAQAQAAAQAVADTRARKEAQAQVQENKKLNIFVINVVESEGKSKNRRDRMVKRFQNQYERSEDFDLTFVDAITLYPKTKLNNLQVNYKSGSKNDDLTIVCGLSHLKAMAMALARGCEYALILEDDMEILSWFDHDQLVSSAPKDWEILQMNMIGPDSDRIYTQKLQSLWIPFSTNFYNTGAYIINRKGMKSVLRNVRADIDRNFSIISVDYGNVKNNNWAETVVYGSAKTYCCTKIHFVEEEYDSTIRTSTQSAEDVAQRKVHTDTRNTVMKAFAEQ